MATFTGVARLFLNEEDQDFTTFAGFREILIDTDVDVFQVGNFDEEAELRDLTVNETVDVDDSEFGLFAYTDGSGVERQGIFLELSGSFTREDEGLFNDDEINFTYRILADGDDLPPIPQGEAIDNTFPQFGVNEIDLDNNDDEFEQYSEDELVAFADLEGLADDDPGLTIEEAQTVALLYEAAFDRQAETDGLNYWIDQREAGLSEIGLAEQFIEADEFENLYGNPDDLSDEEFVELLYNNVLDRGSDGSGFDYWVEQLDSGNLSEAGALLAFADSPENFEQATDIASLMETSDGFYEFV